MEKGKQDRTSILPPGTRPGLALPAWEKVSVHYAGDAAWSTGRPAKTAAEPASLSKESGAIRNGAATP